MRDFIVKYLEKTSDNKVINILDIIIIDINK